MFVGWLSSLGIDCSVIVCCFGVFVCVFELAFPRNWFEFKPFRELTPILGCMGVFPAFVVKVFFYLFVVPLYSFCVVVF